MCCVRLSLSLSLIPTIYLYPHFLSDKLYNNEQTNNHHKTIGIPSNHIPLTYTGNVKNAYWKSWMRQRLLIEQNPHDRTNLRLVDVPYLSDILFHRGNRYAAHLGNVTLRERIETKVIEQYVFEMKNTTSGRTDTTTANVSTTDPVFLPYRTKSLILAIIEELQHQPSGTTPVRFLSWVKTGKDDYGRWERLDSTNDHDKKLIITKAEWLFRECRKSYRKKQKLNGLPPVLPGGGGGTLALDDRRNMSSLNRKRGLEENTTSNTSSMNKREAASISHNTMDDLTPRMFDETASTTAGMFLFQNRPTKNNCCNAG